MSYQRKPLDVYDDEADRVQMDADGRDVLHLWSPNKALKGPIGKVNNVSDYTDFPLEVPPYKGAIVDLPGNVIVSKIVSAKETSKSTPEKPSYYHDVYQITTADGVIYPIAGGFDAAVRRIRAMMGNSSSEPIQSNQAQPNMPVISMPQERLYRLAQIALERLEYPDWEGLPIETRETMLLEADTYDQIHFWLSRTKIPDLGVVLPTGYDLHKLVSNTRLGEQLNGVADETKKRKLLVLAVSEYVKAIMSDDTETFAAALDKALAAIQPYIKKGT